MPLTMFCPALRSCLFVFLICLLLAKMDSSFNADRPDDDLSTAFGTEILAKRDMIPEGFANTPGSRMDMPVEVIGGGRYLRVDQSANLSSTKKLITPEGNALSEATIEATECLKAWWDQGLITRE